MGTPAVRSVVLVTFPFSDFSASKLRPAVGLAAPCQLRPSGQTLHCKRIAHNGQCRRVVGSFATCDYRPRCFPVPSLTGKYCGGWVW